MVEVGGAWSTGLTDALTEEENGETVRDDQRPRLAVRVRVRVGLG